MASGWLRITSLALLLVAGTGTCATAQQSVHIDDYGAWYVKSGVVRRIPANEFLSFPRFWQDYVVFSGAARSGFLIYNAERNTVSDWIEFEGAPSLSIAGRHLLFNTGDVQYTLDSETLRPLGRRRAPVAVYEDWDFGILLPEVIGERTLRYTGARYHLDITYGPRIDLSREYRYDVAGGSEDDTWVVLANDLEDTK